ncbi:SDR family oxidoreductase [Pseudomonas sp. MDMC_285]|nr:SDR family oxidoreductase [Pseudomonas sp. MDMC_285]
MANNAAIPLNGKIALVTGAARGLGVEIARQLAARGAHVIIAARDGAKAEAVAADLRSQGLMASALRLDVTSDDDRRAAFLAIDQSHGRLDILVNNAGVLLDSPDAGMPATWRPSQTPVNVMRDTFEANFFSPLFLTQGLLPLLKRSDAGRVVNVSSIRGSLAHLSDPSSPVYPGHALAYDTSKAALNAFTVLIAEELRGTPIKVNAIHPGWLRTAMGGNQADMSVEDGARTAVQYASLDEQGATGGFFFLDERLPW